jgi:hypothetical protein
MRDLGNYFYKTPQDACNLDGAPGFVPREGLNVLLQRAQERSEATMWDLGALAAISAGASVLFGWNGELPTQDLTDRLNGLQAVKKRMITFLEESS